MKRSQDHIISEELKSAAGKVFHPPGDISEFKIETYATAQQLGIQGGPESASASGSQIQGAPVGLTLNDVSKWYKQTYDALDNKDKKQDAINYLGFLGLMCLRLCVKDPADVAKHIYEVGALRAKELLGISGTFPGYASPSKKFTDDFRSAFKRFTTNCSVAIASLVYSFGHPAPSAASTIQGILRAGCLLSLQKTGMGVFHWMQRAAKLHSVPVSELAMYMALGRFESTNLEVVRLLTDYIGSDPPQYSWMWSRLIKDGAFLELSTRASPMYTAVMMGLVVADPNDPLWQIKSMDIEGMTNLKAIGIARARQIMNSILQKQGETAATEMAKDVWSTAITDAPAEDPLVQY